MLIPVDYGRSSTHQRMSGAPRPTWQAGTLVPHGFWNRTLPVESMTATAGLTGKNVLEELVTLRKQGGVPAPAVPELKMALAGRVLPAE